VGASAIAFVKSESLKINKVRDQISTFSASSPYNYNRCFCSVCGSSLGEILSEEDSFPISANLLDDEVGLTNQFHEFVSEKPNWLVIGDAAKQFEEHPIE
jgi:hypothetical protein